jgi:hypothetical protein
MSSEFYAAPGVTRVLIGATLGGLGAAIGFAIFYLTLTSTTSTKVLSAAGWILAVAAHAVILHWSSTTQHPTCEICGHRAIDSAEEYCLHCYSNTWSYDSINGTYVSKEQWLRGEQVYWFGTQDLDQDNTLDHQEEGSYPKDPSWAPSVSEEDLSKGTDGQ